MSKTPRALDAAIVNLIVDIETRLIFNERSAETNEYRRGYQEALTGLKNDALMIDVIDALKAVGWQAPRRSWVAPPAQAAGAEAGGTES
jgi:hypothetical protein